MANPSGERLAEALRTIFDENVDATESFLSEKNEHGLSIRSAGRSRVGKSMKGKTKSFQQKRYSNVSDECFEDVSDDIFGSASLKGNDQSCSMRENVGSDVNSYETKNSNLSLQAKTADSSLAGNEDVQFATNLPPKDLPKKGKKFDSSFKTCASTSIPPDEVVIEAMKLIFDENVDATRIFALDKKESTRLDSSSHGEDRASGKVKIKAKQKRYRSVLDDLLDDDSDDIFGPAFAKTNKGAPVAEMKVADGEVEQCKLTAGESVDSNHEFVPENTTISGKEERGHTVDICFDSSESKLLLKQDSDAVSDSVSSVAAAQGLHCCSEVELNDSTKNSKELEDQENVSDLKLSICPVEQIAEDESYLASDHDANLKVPFDSEVTFPGTEINDLPASQKVTEIYLPKHEVIKNNVSASSPNKRKQNGVSNGYDELDTISSSSMSEEMEDMNPSKKRKHTGSVLESELMRNVHTESENMLIKIPNFNFVSHTGSDQTFTGRRRNVEEAAEDEEREEKFAHLRRTRPSKSKPCQPIFRFEDNEIETLFGSGRNKSMTSVETKSDRDVVKQARETTSSTKDIDLHNRISDPLLNTESSDNEESHLNTDLQRSRKPEKTENHHEDLSSADAGVLLTRGLEFCSESAQDTKFTAEYPLQQIPLKSGQDGTCSFIFQLPSQYLPNAFLLCAAGILLVAVPSLLILVPIYILALFNAIFITCLLMVGAMVFMVYCGKEKKRVKNTITHAASMEHLQLPDIKYFKSPDDVFKGWMNELSGSYDASNFHISHLRSVYVSLDGRTLRLRTPKKRIPKRSVCSDTIPTPGSFIKQRFYDLSNSKVTTLPEGLVLRRLWSKKYPILIEIPVGQSNKGKPVVDQTGGCDEGTELESLNEKNFTRLFMFARTCREKEEWFRRLFAASSSSVLSSSLCSDGSVKNTPLGTSIQPSVSEAKKDSPCESESPKLLTKRDDQSFSDYLSSMSKVLSLNNESVCDPQLLWINAFISRCTMDVLQESHWIDVIKRKLDKKLLTAKIPFFMDDVRLVEFDLGKEVPFICKATLPSLDDQGLWMDLEITYGGSLSFTIETKCNLLKLKGMSSTDMPRVSRRSSAATNSDEEDSGESSTGDSSDNEEYNDPERQKPRVNWLLRLADRITSSRHFQSALKIDRIKKLMESVSSKSLMLSVEVHSLKGTLAVNIPPPPTDRIWYGFRHMPDLEMSVEVQVGQRQIALTPLTSWIEKKLIVELERALVMPNMDDILFPLMCDHVTNAHVRTTGNSE